MRVGIVVLVEVGMGSVAVDLGGVTRLVGVDCTGEAQDTNRHITSIKNCFFILFFISINEAAQIVPKRLSKMGEPS